MRITESHDGKSTTYSTTLGVPLKKLNISLFKNKIKELQEFEESFKNMYRQVNITYNVFELEGTFYLRNMQCFLNPEDAARDENEIYINLSELTNLNFHIKRQIELIQSRYYSLIATALRRAKEEWNQSFEETCEQLELDDKVKKHILSLINQ